MKTKYSMLLTVLSIALTLPLFAQEPYDKTKTDMSENDISGKMGTPTVDVTVDGFHLRGWMMTQQQHSSMMKDRDTKGMKHEGMSKDMKGMHHDSMAMGNGMKGMKHDGMEMDKATKEAMMAGTHHFMLDVTDLSTGKETAHTSAKVMIVSPSKKNSSINLISVKSHLGNGLTLNEKGEYQFTVRVNVNGASKTTQFQYAVK